MKRFNPNALFALGALVVAGSGAAALKTPAPHFAPVASHYRIDQPAKSFTLDDVSKATPAPIALADFQGKKPLCLIFLSHKCGVVQRYEGRLTRLFAKYGKDVQFFDVRCNEEDTPQQERDYVAKKGWNLPILDDSKGDLTRYFDAHHTPTFALMDSKGLVRYYGAFDNAPDEPDVSTTYLPGAIDAVLAGKPVSVKETKAIGCGIHPVGGYTP